MAVKDIRAWQMAWHSILRDRYVILRYFSVAGNFDAARVCTKRSTMKIQHRRFQFSFSIL